MLRLSAQDGIYRHARQNGVEQECNVFSNNQHESNAQFLSVPPGKSLK